MIKMFNTHRVYLIVFVVLKSCLAFPDQGKWDFILNEDKNELSIQKSLFNNSKIYIHIDCDETKIKNPNNVKISIEIVESQCWDEYLRYDEVSAEPEDKNIRISREASLKENSVRTLKSILTKCGTAILDPDYLDDISTPTSPSGKPENGKSNTKTNSGENSSSQNLPGSGKSTNKTDPLSDSSFFMSVPMDSIYRLRLGVTANMNFNLSVHVEMKSSYGYLSAVDWPLLPFYGAMCIVYVLLGLIWLTVSFCQWRDLLRIQFWIGGVILLGMLEKATFYAEYQSINSTGISVKGAVLLAELVSCGKRTLARMLVIIVSLGFGIVKPRLGPMLHRVVGIGILYFILAAVESYLRVMHPKNDPSNQILVASIPLAVLDSAICWWIFSSLVQTTRTLRLRRNMVKLSLYQHFTNTLIFAVISSVVFMLYSIMFHKLNRCLRNWPELWLDEAYWHILFSVLLLVIMILWRPTNNNQRYAFTPLLDAPEDDENEEEQFVNDAFANVKMRSIRSNSPKPKSTTNDEDDLKWVEENIPSAMSDLVMPCVDSDEEMLTTKFEVSKMQ